MAGYPVSSTAYTGPGGTRTHTPPIDPMEAVCVDVTLVAIGEHHPIELVGTDDRCSEVLLRDVPLGLLSEFFDSGYRPQLITLESEIFEGGDTEFIATSRGEIGDTTFSIEGEFDESDAKVAKPYSSEDGELPNTPRERITTAQESSSDRGDSTSIPRYAYCPVCGHELDTPRKASTRSLTCPEHGRIHVEMPDY